MVATAAAGPFAARAQQPAYPIIGFLSPASPTAHAPYVAGFLLGLGETGYVEGRNVAVEYRWAEDQLDRLPAMAVQLVDRQVSVILASATSAAALAFMLLVIPQSARAARKKARQIVENLLLPAINLVRVNAVPLRQLRHRRYLAQCLQAILALNAASNFLRDLVISVLRRLRQSRTLHTLRSGPISGVHFIHAKAR